MPSDAPHPLRPRPIKVGYSRKASALMTGMGVVLTACAAVSVFTPFLPVLVPIGLTGLALLGAGLGALFRPRYLYDPATGALTVFMAIGPGREGVGAEQGERVYFDGRRIIRELPDGSRHRVSLVGTNRDHAARLIQALPTEPGERRLPPPDGPAITGR